MIQVAYYYACLQGLVVGGWQIKTRDWLRPYVIYGVMPLGGITCLFAVGSFSALLGFVPFMPILLCLAGFVTWGHRQVAWVQHRGGGGGGSAAVVPEGSAQPSSTRLACIVNPLLKALDAMLKILRWMWLCLPEQLRNSKHLDMLSQVQGTLW